MTTTPVYDIIIPEGTRKTEKERKKMTFDEMYDILRDYVGVTEQALDLAFAVGGCNEETAERILFYFTGWRSFGGFLDEIED